jgi:predicted oxidoreductase
LQRSTSKKFFKNILNSKKKIISISPLVGGNFIEIMNNFDPSLKKKLDAIMIENDLSNYNSLNIAFLKSIHNMEFAIFGTKNIDRLLNIESEIEKIKPLKKGYLEKILTLQEEYKSNISF